MYFFTAFEACEKEFKIFYNRGLNGKPFSEMCREQEHSTQNVNPKEGILPKYEPNCNQKYIWPFGFSSQLQ